ncbi:MAG: YXWGXW repeat-containing protein [Terriglobales bacterium]
MKHSVRGLVLVLMLSVSVLSLSTASSAQIGIGISVRIGPPALPVYAQPICPGPGYLWTPGYWAWSDDGGYYWVPGTWVVAPVGMLWTPGYWGFAGGVYAWHPGYWGPHVGFYGGINYGFGYRGVGFFGGEWRGGAFFYNRAVMNVNLVNVRNVYSKTVVVNNVHTSFNGPGGIEARPTPQEEAYGREQHTAALSTQREHERAASQNRALFASANHGRPEIAATGRPGEFSGAHVERASAAGAAYREPRMSPAETRGSAAGNRGFSDAVRHDGNFNDHATNHDAANREPSRDNAKPGKQEKQAQKRADKQAKAEQKRNEREER